MSRLVCVGAATSDTIALVPRLPGPDERLVAEAVVTAGGGPAATAAVAAARLGIDVAFVGAVSDDAEGSRVLAELEREGVDVSGVHRVDPGEGGASVILVDRGSGTRSIATRPVRPFDVSAGTRAATLLATATWVLVDHLGWGAIAHAPLPSHVRLAVDAGNPIPGLDLRRVHLLVPTITELERWYGERPPFELLARAREDGARMVVATAGARGAVAITSDGRQVGAGGFDVEVVSTLGAGDVFHGALMAAVLRGEPPRAALRYANAAAALSCRSLDGRSGIPTDDEVRALLAR